LGGVWSHSRSEPIGKWDTEKAVGPEMEMSGTIRLAPETVTDCNCSICRRYGALLAYYSPKLARARIRHLDGAATKQACVGKQMNDLLSLDCASFRKSEDHFSK
jgi:hypothetical protein